MMTITVLIVWVFYELLLVQSSPDASATVPQYEGRLDGTPSNLIVAPDWIYTSVRNIGVAFNSTLSSSSRTQFTDSINRDSAIAAMTLVPGHNTMIVCLYDESCHAVWPLSSSRHQLYTSNHLEDIRFPRGSTLLSEQSESDSRVYFGSTEVDSNGSKLIHLGIIHIESNNYGVKTSSRIIQSVQVTSKNFVSRDFIFNFCSGECCYFIARDKFVNHSMITVLRVSRTNDSSTFPRDPIVEVRVECNMVDNNFTIASQSKMNQTIILGLNSASSSTLCTFTIADIDQTISSTLSKCKSGNYVFSLPWSHMQSSCSDFAKQIKVGVVASSTPVIGSNLVALTHGREITAATVLEINQTHFYLYVAQSGRNHIIEKFLIRDGTTSVRKVQPVVELSHRALLMRQGSGLVYVATAKQIMGFEVDVCHKHRSCQACVTSANPTCGWCATEDKCSRYSECKLDHGTGYYSGQGSRLQCIAAKSFVVSESSMAMDNLQPLRLVTGLTSLPLPFNMEYNILCTSEHQDFSVQGFISGSDVYCNFTSSNVSSIMRHEAESLVRFAIVLELDNEITTFSNIAVHFHNCSMHFRCGECELVSVCGWCAYKNKCTGSSRHCLLDQNWTRKQAKGSTSVCPALFPAKSGRYVLPVGVSANISLLTRNVPPPGHGTRYICKLQYSNGDFIYTAATYNSSIQVHCQIGTGQVVISKAAQDKGVEHLSLTLWTEGSSGVLHQIDHISEDGMKGDQSNDGPSSSLAVSPPSKPRSARMAVFNCSYYSESCSFCMTANNPEFVCGWCLSGSGVQGSCTTLQSCSSNDNSNYFINSSTRCFSYPIIKSVFPVSGPTAGGTIVSITGTDLGVASNEIEVKLGSSNCTILHSSYEPARKVFCVSEPSASIGAATIVVTVKRSTSTDSLASMFDDGVTDSFYYDTPYLHSISPAYGPLSGGTLVVLDGSALNVSNTALTAVRVARTFCNILNITYNKIYCETSAVETATSDPMRLSIDHAILQGANFTYMENPEFHSLQPQHTIPAGGVILKITGNYLNTSLQPMLVVFLDSKSYSTRCVAASSQLLLCAAPKLSLTPSHFTSDTSSQLGRSGEGESEVFLNYTIVMDGAPGPNISNQSLSLTVRQDPVFFEFNNYDEQYELFSGKLISINGINLDSVHFSEISVTLLEEPCNIYIITATEITCKPPDFPIRNDRNIDVKVSVANGALIYNIGSLRYIKSSGTDNTSENPFSAGENPFSSMMFIIVVSCVGLSLVLLLIGLIIAVSTVTIKRHNRVQKVKKEIELPDSRTESCLDKSNSENWYEVISDSIVPIPNGSLCLESDYNTVIQPSHVSTNGGFHDINGGFHDINGESSQQLPAASAHSHSSTSICKGPIVGRQSYPLMHGPPHPNEEYVRMCPHQICSNPSISTNIHIDKQQALNDRLSMGDYVDMQSAEQRSKYTTTADQSYHMNLETIL